MSINERKRFLAIIDACNRAAKLGVRWERCNNPHMTLMMDLQNTLSYKEVKMLNSFDDENFAHDIVGIQFNLNRNTKMLENFFVPRCKDAVKGAI